MKFSIAGTFSATVTFSDWISSQTLVGSKARITTLVTPRYTLPRDRRQRADVEERQRDQVAVLEAHLGGGARS